MDEVVATLFVIWVCISTMLAGVFVTVGSLDATVVKNCKEQGYWQTGQTRVICNVEEKKK